MGRVVWPGEPFLKKCPNIKKRPLFSKYACPFFQEQVPKMSFSPMSHRQPLAMGSSRGGAPRKCRGVWGGRSPPQDDTLILLFYITVFPDTQVISECLVLQYFQIHGSSKCLVLQYFQIHGSSKCLVLQYFQKSGLYQNAWSFSISRFAGRKIKFSDPDWTFWD